MMDIIKNKMSLCIELKDAFTNQSIEAEDIHVQVNGYLPSIRKERRYYIFQDMQTDIIEVDIMSKIYEHRHCVIQLVKHRNGNLPVYVQEGSIRNLFGIPLLSIVLYPNERYVLPVGYKRIEYRGKPWEEVRVIKDRKCAYLLAANYHGGEIIQLLMHGRQNPESMYLRIENKDAKGYEDFNLLEQRDTFQYVMYKSLEREYERGSKVYELYCTIANEKGIAVVIVKEGGTANK